MTVYSQTWKIHLVLARSNTGLRNIDLNEQIDPMYFSS